MRFLSIPHLALQIIRSRSRRLDAPYKITFLPTYRCNLQCRYCLIWKESNRREMSLEEIERFFAASPDIYWLNLSGGEVTLRPDLPRMIEVALRHCPDLVFINFPTNGFDPERITEQVRRVAELGPPFFAVTVGVDGPPEVHDRLRGADGSWENSVRTFSEIRRVLRNPRHRVFIGYTLYPENAALLPATLDLIRERAPQVTVRDIHLNFGHSSPHYYGEVTIDPVPPSAVSSALDFAGRGAGLLPMDSSWLEHRYRDLLKRFVITRETPLPCRALSASCMIDPEWNVYPCIGFNAPVGNLAQHDFDLHKLWDGPSAENIYRQIREGKCPQCWTPCEAYPAILARPFRGR